MAHIRKILVPIDGSPPSIAALAHAVMLAQDLDATVEVLHVEAPDRFEVGSSTGRAASAQRETARALTDAVASAKAKLQNRLRQRSERGDPTRRILDAAVAGKVDLIVMGTHGRIGRLRAIVGSVTEAVVRNSPCPVLTIRQPNHTESFSERVHGRKGMAEARR